MPTKNRTFPVEDETYRRLKILSAERSTTLGRTIEHLLDLQNCVASRGTLIFQGQNGTLELNLNDLIPDQGEF